MGVRVIHLVRHGQAKPDGDMALTPLGVTQAACVAARLATLKHPPTTLRSSTVLRAKQTAAVLAAALPHAKVLPRLASLAEGYPCRMPRERLHASDRDRDDAWWRKEIGRHERAWRAISAPNLDDGMVVDVVVAHGNVISSMAMRALGVPIEAFLQTGVGNCSITTIVVEPTRTLLVRLNEGGHLPST